jgi:hypothetical protein
MSMSACPAFSSFVSRLACQVLLAISACIAIAPHSRAAECGEECLVDVMNTYLDAMVVIRDIAAVPVAANVKVTENGQRVPLGSGIFKSARAIPYRHIFADATTGQVGLHAVADEGGRLAVFSARLHVTDGRIDEIDTITAREGEASLFAPETMIAPDPLYEEILAPHQRTPRQQMIAAANGYYEGIVNGDPSLVPAAPGCWRVENGVQTQKIPALVLAGHCNLGHKAFAYINPIRNRRFPLVDEARGLVWALVIMDIKATPPVLDAQGNVVQPGRKPRSILVRELFKISSGKIRRMDVVMRDLPLGEGSGWDE